jgi:MoaA/NifB/PqqE/SkfB family radical SAM enzyme
MTVAKNVPKSLEPVVNRWLAEQRDFYLGPENLFRFDQHPIRYLANPDISTQPGAWCCDNRARRDEPIRDLTPKEVQEIAMELARHYRPLRWTISLDYHCNYDCPMCPYHGTGYEGEEEKFQDYWEKHASQKRVVSKEEAFETIDILKENGIQILSLQSAGELFLYPHWKEVALYAGSKGFKLWGITNGSLADEKACQILQQAGFTDMRVSLDAVSFEVYSQIRSRRREFYDRAMRAPLLLQQHGIKVNVHFVKQAQNLHERDAFLNHWKQTEVDSISIANQFVYSADGCANKFAPEEKPPRFIHGLCTKYGNFASWHDGTIIPCCGATPIYTDNPDHLLPKLTLKQGNFKECVETMNQLMSQADSPFRKICATCSLYTAYSTEKRVDGWVVNVNPERETWTRA